ncbi:MAG: Omp28-related outer membrane protein [Bacteroidales bacterium]|nr:Omp28-related outer membrane protein [Bacteroidales bacterium]
MKKSLLILICALISCVGQKEDPEEEINPGGTTPVAGSAGIVLDFTATWCVNCPRMTTAIEEAAAERPLIPICVHFQDEFVNDQGKELISHFGVEAYPSAVVNMFKESLTTTTSKDLIIAKLKTIGAMIAVPILEAELVDGALKVRVTGGDNGSYTISAAVLEDGLVAPQTGAADNYVHNNVFRGFLQENLLGDPLGELSPGDTVERSFAVTLAQNQHLAVYVCIDGIAKAATDIRI